MPSSCGCARGRASTLAFAAVSLLGFSYAHAATLRIVSYNILGDNNADGSGAIGTGLETVLSGIGNLQLNDNGNAHAQPLDVLAVQELSVTTSASELQAIVTSLNAAYGANTYSYDATTDPTTGGQGGGPSGLIYNTKTVRVVSAAPLGTASGSGAPRAPMQYLLQPVGLVSSAAFYLDVSHAKSGTTSGDASRRNGEAVTITSNVSSLGSNAHVIAVGDFNITGGSSEQTYQTLRTQFHDPGNSAGNWDDQTLANQQQFASLLSESSTKDQYRDDLQLLSAAADSNSAVPGLHYDLGSYTVFGNGGSSSLAGQAVNSASNTGVFPGFSSSYRTTVLNALTTASDHLPVVADYDIVGVAATPEPGSLGLLGLGGLLLLKRRRPRVST